MSSLASTYERSSSWKKAEELEEQVFEIRKRILGAEHPDTLTSIANLAKTRRETRAQSWAKIFATKTFKKPKGYVRG
jgi:Tetratricopeptide repeat